MVPMKKLDQNSIRNSIRNSNQNSDWFCRTFYHTSPKAWVASSDESLLGFWWNAFLTRRCGHPGCMEPASILRTIWWCNVHDPEHSSAMKQMIAQTQKNRLKAKEAGLM